MFQIKRRNLWTFEGKLDDEITFKEAFVKVSSIPFGVTKEYADFSMTYGNIEIHHCDVPLNYEGVVTLIENICRTITGFLRMYSPEQELLDEWTFEDAKVALVDCDTGLGVGDCCNFLYNVEYKSCIWKINRPLFRLNSNELDSTSTKLEDGKNG